MAFPIPWRQLERHDGKKQRRRSWDANLILRTPPCLFVCHVFMTAVGGGAETMIIATLAGRTLGGFLAVRLSFLATLTVRCFLRLCFAIFAMSEYITVY